MTHFELQLPCHSSMTSHLRHRIVFCYNMQSIIAYQVKSFYIKLSVPFFTCISFTSCILYLSMMLSCQSLLLCHHTQSPSHNSCLHFSFFSYFIILISSLQFTLSYNILLFLTQLCRIPSYSPLNSSLLFCTDSVG